VQYSLRRTARTLNAPGKFLISAPEHDTPHRARAYLVTDEAVTETAGRHASLRPQLDEVSRRALTERPASLVPGRPPKGRRG
jgi:S-DNA-T family DNA segregation ATPase FtsK/SpoIIIE